MKTKLKQESGAAQNTKSGALSKNMMILLAAGIIPVAAMIYYMKYKKQKEANEKA